MKRKVIQNLAPKPAKKEGEVFTVQVVEDFLIINYWENKKLIGRYCMNTKTHEYEAYYAKEGKWRQTRLMGLCGVNPNDYWYYSLEVAFDSEEDEKLVKSCLPERKYCNTAEAVDRISYYEMEYSRNQRESKEERRRERIRELMSKVPSLPDNFKDWIFCTAARSSDYAFSDKHTVELVCTACGSRHVEGQFVRADGGSKIRHNDMAICPSCKKIVQIKKRTGGMRLQTNAMLFQDIDADMSVARHFDIRIEWSAGKRDISLSEAVRIFLLRDSRKSCKIFYSHDLRTKYRACNHFDTSNPCNRRIEEEYLYPDGIEQALRGTDYGVWERPFVHMAAAGRKSGYNNLMAMGNNQDFANVVECLLKGRFNRLLKETAQNVYTWSCKYHGSLNAAGTTIEEVFGLSDRQKINRIRDCDGGEDILEWMRWSEDTGKKIDDDTLRWLTKENVTRSHIRFMPQMSPRQIMNYVIRQQAGEYSGKRTAEVLGQWEDYLSMCKRLGKDLSDEMVYRPRQLKRRHSEAVEEIRKIEMIERMKYQEEADGREAEKMREKYPGAEEALEEIRSRYEYQNEDYIITVPKKLLDIVKEGTALHHCAGSSERYFERIMQRETYICFLRRKTEPDIPYYTIEVEPGGTIRQHRSLYDEEPGIEEIRGFLREWQRVLKKRLNEEDRRLAGISAQKRRKNIEELREKNNTRVLKGLEEDFMEAV